MAGEDQRDLQVAGFQAGVEPRFAGQQCLAPGAMGVPQEFGGGHSFLGWRTTLPQQWLRLCGVQAGHKTGLLWACAAAPAGARLTGGNTDTDCFDGWPAAD